MRQDKAQTEPTGSALRIQLQPQIQQWIDMLTPVAECYCQLIGGDESGATRVKLRVIYQVPTGDKVHKGENIRRKHGNDPI